MSKKSLTSKEILKIIDHDLADVEDIKKLGCCGKNRAYQYISEMRKSINASGRRVICPKGKIQMKYVIEFFEIDIPTLKRMAYIGGVIDE